MSSVGQPDYAVGNTCIIISNCFRFNTVQRPRNGSPEVFTIVFTRNSRICPVDHAERRIIKTVRAYCRSIGFNIIIAHIRHRTRIDRNITDITAIVMSTYHNASRASICIFTDGNTRYHIFRMRPGSPGCSHPRLSEIISQFLATYRTFGKSLMADSNSAALVGIVVRMSVAADYNITRRRLSDTAVIFNTCSCTDSYIFRLRSPTPRTDGYAVAGSCRIGGRCRQGRKTATGCTQ